MKALYFGRQIDNSSTQSILYFFPEKFVKLSLFFRLFNALLHSSISNGESHITLSSSDNLLMPGFSRNSFSTDKVGFCTCDSECNSLSYFNSSFTSFRISFSFVIWPFDAS